MSDKELLYLKDALNHEKLMQTKCTDYAQAVQDRELKLLVKEIETWHKETFNALFRLL